MSRLTDWLLGAPCPDCRTRVYPRDVDSHAEVCGTFDCCDRHRTTGRVVADLTERTEWGVRLVPGSIATYPDQAAAADSAARFGGVVVYRVGAVDYAWPSIRDGWCEV